MTEIHNKFTKDKGDKGTHLVLVLRELLSAPTKSIKDNKSMTNLASQIIVQGVFFNWASPEYAKCWNYIHFARHLDVFRSKGGPVWDSDVFFEISYLPANT